MGHRIQVGSPQMPFRSTASSYDHQQLLQHAAPAQIIPQPHLQQPQHQSQPQQQQQLSPPLPQQQQLQPQQHQQQLLQSQQPQVPIGQRQQHHGSNSVRPFTTSSPVK